MNDPYIRSTPLTEAEKNRIAERIGIYLRKENNGYLISADTSQHAAHYKELLSQLNPREYLAYSFTCSGDFRIYRNDENFPIKYYTPKNALNAANDAL